MVNGAFVRRVCWLQFSIRHGVDRVWHSDAMLLVKPDAPAGFQHHNGHFAGADCYYGSPLRASIWNLGLERAGG